MASMDRGDRLHDRLAALVAAEPDLAEGLALRGALIELIDLANVPVGELRVPADLIRARLAAGVPLLQQLAVPIPASIVGLFERLTVAMLTDPSVREPAEGLLQAIRTHRLHPEQLVAEAIVGHAEHLEQLAEAANVPSSLVDPLADLAARPLLAAIARRLAPALGLHGWTTGYCPVCGGRPILAERAIAGGGEAGPPSARLRCGRCATGWPWPWAVPACPICADGDLEPVASLPVYDLGIWDLFGCRICHSAVKRADGPRSERLAHLLLDDLATWRLDQEALAEGLSRPSGIGHRLEHADVAMSEHDDD
jgi:FdhE protein